MKNRIKYFILKFLGFFPESSNVDFYGGDYGKSLNIKLKNVPTLPKILMIGDPLFKKTDLYRVNQLAINYGNEGVSLNVFKVEENINAAMLHLRNTFKYSVFKVWFTLPKAENCIFTIGTIGADGLPESVLFEYDCDKPNKAVQSVSKGYSNGKELSVNKMRKISYKKLEQLNGLCAEVEFKPTRVCALPVFVPDKLMINDI